LLSKRGKIVQTFPDPLSSIQEQVLDLLDVSPTAYASNKPQKIRLIRLRNVGDMFDVRDLDEFMERGKPSSKIMSKIKLPDGTTIMRQYLRSKSPTSMSP
jgi:hypothetical protein